MSAARPLTDPELPGLAVVTGPEATALLDAAVAPHGEVLDARLAQIRYVPGRSVVAQYSAKLSLASGGTSRETIVAAAGREAPAEALTFEADGIEVALWLYPHDPALPGLNVASDPDAVRDLLDQLGAPADEVRLRRRAYRPGRRAVIEVVTPRSRVYLKILRPERTAALQAKHTIMADHLPVPHSFGWSKTLGLVALQAMPGKTLRKTLESGKRRLPTGEQFASLLDAIPTDLETPVDGPVVRVRSYANLLGAVAPGLTQRVEAVVAATAAVAPEPQVPVHGDFHSSQILVRDGAVAGLIDVDTAGRGERSNDLAQMLAHLATLAEMGRARRNIDRYGASLIASFDRMVDPRDLRLRTAAAILGFATGPFRVQEQRWESATERRVALAERWAHSATNLK